MEIHFASKADRLLSDKKKLIKKYGDKAAKTVDVVLSVLRAAANLEEVPNIPPTRRHKLEGDLSGLWAIDISKNYRLIIKPIDGEFELKKIRSIEILDVVDYH